MQALVAKLPSWAASRRRKKLLEPGWGGEVNDVELAYIQRKLLEDKHLSCYPPIGFNVVSSKE